MLYLFVGDPCSGKSSVLRRLRDEGHVVVLEHGWEQIRPEVELDKQASNVWFCDYYHARDKKILEQYSTSDCDLSFERILQYQYPFSKAQLRSGKISKEEYDGLVKYIDTLVRDVPLRELTVFHFLSDYRLTQKRLAERGIYKDETQFVYWDMVREETRSYFEPLATAYHVIDTVDRSLDEVYENVTGLFV